MTDQAEVETGEEQPPEPKDAGIFQGINIPPEIKDLRAEDRRALLKRLRAAAPKAKDEQLAEVFGVSVSTIYSDIAIIRGENSEKADAWACELEDAFD